MLFSESFLIVLSPLFISSVVHYCLHRLKHVVGCSLCYFILLMKLHLVLNYAITMHLMDALSIIYLWSIWRLTIPLEKCLNFYRKLFVLSFLSALLSNLLYQRDDRQLSKSNSCRLWKQQTHTNVWTIPKGNKTDCISTWWSRYSAKKSGKNGLNMIALFLFNRVFYTQSFVYTHTYNT